MPSTASAESPQSSESPPAALVRTANGATYPLTLAPGQAAALLGAGPLRRV